MIIYKTGNLLNATEVAIAHQVNCRGVMGGGIAKQIRKKYPEVFEAYHCHCRLHYGLLMGTYTTTSAASDERRIVFNLFAQKDFGTDRRYTNYSAFASALYHACCYCRNLGLKEIALPYGIGCGLAGGDWNIILPIIKDTSELTDVDIVIYKLED